MGIFIYGRGSVRLERLGVVKDRGLGRDGVQIDVLTLPASPEVPGSSRRRRPEGWDLLDGLGVGRDDIHGLGRVIKGISPPEDEILRELCGHLAVSRGRSSAGQRICHSCRAGF